MQLSNGLRTRTDHCHPSFRCERRNGWGRVAKERKRRSLSFLSSLLPLLLPPPLMVPFPSLLSFSHPIPPIIPPSLIHTIITPHHSHPQEKERKDLRRYRVAPGRGLGLGFCLGLGWAWVEQAWSGPLFVWFGVLWAGVTCISYGHTHKGLRIGPVVCGIAKGSIWDISHFDFFIFLGC